jgi:hypothetical protein
MSYDLLNFPPVHEFYVQHALEQLKQVRRGSLWIFDPICLAKKIFTLCPEPFLHKFPPPVLGSAFFPTGKNTKYTPWPIYPRH